MIVIHFKLEPNSYVFQLNATSFHLNENGSIISAKTNDFVLVGTQYSTQFLSINNYNGTDYYLSNDVLPSETIWIKH